MATGVALGAFGAHGLDGRVDADLLSTWRTASDYHQMGALGLLALGIRPLPPALSRPGLLIAAGTLIFSGSLYALVLTELRWLGALTPLGGLSLIVGWAWLGWVLRAPTAHGDHASPLSIPAAPGPPPTSEVPMR